VTEEIANRFQATALRALRRHPARPIEAAPSPLLPVGPSARNSPAHSASGHHHGWVWMGMGTAAALTAAVGGYYFFADHGGTREDVTRIDLTRP